MKKIIYSAIGIFGLFMAAGCEDFLTEKTNGQIFTNVLEEEAGLESALTGAYRGLNLAWNYGITNGTYQQLCSGAEDIYCPTSDANGTQLDRCATTDANGSFSSTWNGLYKVIVGANQVINSYENCSGTEATITVIAGEAFFLRALANFILVRLWNDIPLVTSSSYNEADAEMYASSPEEVYELIESDIQNAIDMLDDNRRNSEVGRPNKLVAKALQAEIYLTMAGAPLHKSGYYQKAADVAKDVLDNSASAGFSLVDDFSKLYINKEEEDNITTEDLFVLPASSSNIIVFYGAWCEPSEIGGWDIIFAEVGFMNSFPEGVRKDYTFYTSYTDSNGNEVSWENWKQKHPSILKLMKYPQGGQNNYSNCSSVLPMHVLRMSQTALTYAEAIARASGPTDEAYTWLNKIRTRAGLESYSGLSTSDFIDAVVQERAWELAGECVRWYDLLRLEMVEESFENKDPDYDPSCLNTTGVFTFPIPSNETLLNPNLK